MRVLVTGGAGFIGSALVRALLGEGHNVRVLDDFSRGQRERLPDDAHCFCGDIRDPQMTTVAARHCDAIYHLAYLQGTQTFYSDPRLVIDVALRGILNVLDAARGKDLILVSSSEVYQIPPDGMTPTAEDVPLSVPDVTNPRYSYGAGKIACEVAALAHSDRLARLVIVRPHNIFGPDMGHEHVIPEFCDRMRDLLARAETAGFEGVAPGPLVFPIQGTGAESRSFCHISDAVDGLTLLLEKGEHRTVYHLGTEDEVSIGRLAGMVAECCGCEIELAPGSLPKGSPPRRLPDISRLRALGYEPRVSLEAGLAEVVEWYMREPARV